MKYFPFIAALFFPCVLHAQSVKFYFPHFAGNEYVFYLYQGEKNDTVQTGKIGEDGRLLLSLPDNHRDYQGIANWKLTDGGGLSFILAGETFSIACTEAMPSDTNIVYSSTPENECLRLLSDQRNRLFQKAEVIYRGQEVYNDDKKLSIFFKRELTRLKKAFARLQPTERTEVYAGQYFRISNFLNGVGSELYLPGEEDKLKEDLRRFVNEQLNIDVLYTSGYWNSVISATFELFPDPMTFAGAMVNNLSRSSSQKVFETFSDNLMDICEQFNWTDAEDSIVSYLKTSGKISYPQGKLFLAYERSKTRTGKEAIPIPGIDDLKNCLLVFYESGCDNCQTQIEAIQTHYSQLTEHGIRVISIAADTDPEEFKKYSANFPWKDKLCDYQGHTGENFINYGIFGTPTLFLIDENGKLSGRYALLEEVLKVEN